jgi:hypothetical protein
LQEFQRISADNSRLHKALNRIKPTVPSLKEVEIRTKDLERWYKNGCKLPDVLYDNSNSNSPVAERALPGALSPSRPARSFAHRGQATNMDVATSMRNIPVLKQMMQANKTLNQVPVASPKRAAAGREFDSNKSLMGRMRPELLSEVCDVKQPPAALRQLLQAACSALGKLSRLDPMNDSFSMFLLGEPSHAIACINCMSDIKTSYRLSQLQASSMVSSDADAFMAHMTGCLLLCQHSLTTI